jgi:hypothetical protein
MISCERLRASLQVDDRRPEILEHLRGCDACLRMAVDIDPEVLFRSIGGDGLVPQGGVDLFAADVMRQIELRRKSAGLAHHGPNRLLRWAAAAVIVTGFAVSSAVYREHGVVTNQARQASMRGPVSASQPAALSNRSVVENYASDNATIMEVPVNSDNNDVKVVMIFDQSLPADL